VANRTYGTHLSKGMINMHKPTTPKQAIVIPWPRVVVIIVVVILVMYAMHLGYEAAAAVALASAAGYAAVSVSRRLAR
jgi:hypothetical protein